MLSTIFNSTVRDMSDNARPRLRRSSSGGRGGRFRGEGNAAPTLFGFGFSSNHSGGDLAIVMARSASDEREAPVQSELTKERGLRSSEAIDAEGMNNRAVYLIRNRRTGAITGVRKIVYETDERRGYYHAVLNEASVYEDLQTKAGWREHILPFRQATRHPRGVVLDFDWVDGSDLSKYFKVASPREIKEALYRTARQLLWLAEIGYHHGDVKADNIYRTVDGRILLFDFDKAKRHIVGATVFNERHSFVNLISGHVSEHTLKKITELPIISGLPAFYLRASRLIQKEYKDRRTRTYRRHRQRANHRRTVRRH